MTYEYVISNWSNFATFACKTNSKIPATKNGFKDAEKGYDVLEMIQKGYNAGLHLAESFLIAIDLDVDLSKGYNGLETLAKLEEKLGKLPKTLTQKTPRGGKHLIYSAKGIINPIGKIGKDIDIKYHGYIMIMPSSINGKPYEIIDGLDENVDFIIAELPQTWLDFINKTAPTATGKNFVKTNERKVYTNINIKKMFNSCAFLHYCKDNADCLLEPEWHSMITILAQIEGSDELIHNLSEPYPKYNYEETQKKIDYARKFGHPQSCKYLSSNYPEICENCPSSNRKAV